MKKSLKELAIHLTACVLMGAAMMGGMRAVEWYVPKPQTRVIFCMNQDLDKPVCKTAEELLRREGE